MTTTPTPRKSPQEEARPFRVVGIAIFTASAMILTGCTHHHSPLNTSKCPNAQPLNPTGWALGTANYEAQIVQDVLVIQASGENPAPNYEEKLALQMPDMFPPKFALYMRQSPGSTGQPLTEFQVCTKYRLSPSQSLQIKSVAIKDAKGDHTVPIELVGK